MISRALVDTGPLVAILNRSDAKHDVCVRQLEDLGTPLFTCWSVLTEACYLLRRVDPSAARRLLDSADGTFLDVLALDKQDLPPIVVLLRKYENLGLQLADAAILHLANREQIDCDFTLDRRDFDVAGPPTRRSLRIIPSG